MFQTVITLPISFITFAWWNIKYSYNQILPLNRVYALKTETNLNWKSYDIRDDYGIVQLWLVVKFDWHVSYSASYQWRHYLLPRRLVLVISLNLDSHNSRLVNDVLYIATILTNDLSYNRKW